jgi:hypothetical protein
MDIGVVLEVDDVVVIGMVIEGNQSHLPPSGPRISDDASPGLPTPKQHPITSVHTIKQQA